MRCTPCSGGEVRKLRFLLLHGYTVCTVAAYVSTPWSAASTRACACVYPNLVSAAAYIISGYRSKHGRRHFRGVVPNPQSSCVDAKRRGQAGSGITPLRMPLAAAAQERGRRKYPPRAVAATKVIPYRRAGARRNAVKTPAVPHVRSPHERIDQCKAIILIVSADPRYATTSVREDYIFCFIFHLYRIYTVHIHTSSLSYSPSSLSPDTLIRRFSPVVKSWQQARTVDRQRSFGRLA
jgi:hypothetical protein